MQDLGHCLSLAQAKVLGVTFQSPLTLTGIMTYYDRTSYVHAHLFRLMHSLNEGAF